MMFLNVILTLYILLFIRKFKINFISRGLVYVNIMFKRSSCHMTEILHQKSDMIDRINTIYVYIFLPYEYFCLCCLIKFALNWFPFGFVGTFNIHTVKRSVIYSSAIISAKHYFAAAIKIKPKYFLKFILFYFWVSL